MSDDPLPGASAALDQLRAAFARDVQAAPGIPAALRDGASGALKTFAEMAPFAWARDFSVEMRNKFDAFTQFDETKRRAAAADLSHRSSLPSGLLGSDHAANMWRTEGLGASLARLSSGSADPQPLGAWIATLNLPSRCLFPLHTGGGLALAEEAVARQRKARKNDLARAVLDDFQNLAAERSSPGLHDALFEALGLVLQTMHPDLLTTVADELRTRNPSLHRLLWHGAGRGHYFDPFQFVLPSSLRPLSYLAGTDEASLNRLSGYVWAVTLVNLRTPMTAARVLSSIPRPDERSLRATVAGIGAATVVWLELTSDRSTLSNFQDALTSRRVFEDQDHAAAIRSAIERRAAAPPASPETLGALYSFDPEAPDPA